MPVDLIEALRIAVFDGVVSEMPDDEQAVVAKEDPTGHKKVDGLTSAFHSAVHPVSHEVKISGNAEETNQSCLKTRPGDKHMQ